jgi:hypothetical protein
MQETSHGHFRTNFIFFCAIVTLTMWCRGAALASWSYGCRFAPILYVLKALS